LEGKTPKEIAIYGILQSININDYQSKKCCNGLYELSVYICGVDLFFVNLTDKYALLDRICLSQTSPQPVQGKLCLRVKLTKNKSTPQM